MLAEDLISALPTSHADASGQSVQWLLSQWSTEKHLGQVALWSHVVAPPNEWYFLSHQTPRNSDRLIIVGSCWWLGTWSKRSASCHGYRRETMRWFIPCCKQRRQILVRVRWRRVAALDRGTFDWTSTDATCCVQPATYTVHRKKTTAWANRHFYKG